MKFVAKQDAELPQQTLFDRMADFQMFERVAIRRGVDVVRTGSLASKSGIKWDCKFEFRARKRDACVQVTEFNSPDHLAFLVTNTALNIKLEIMLSALSKKQSRLLVTSVIEPKTLAARLLVQSMKLTRSKYNQRYQKRVAEVANELAALGPA